MRSFFHLFRPNKALTKKISELEKKITDLAAKISEVKSDVHKAAKEEQENGSSPTIHIEHLHIDKITIKHVDYANNFGQLGIKELSGKLNIGTIYEGDFSKKINEKLDEKMGNNAKVNLRAKKES